MNVSTLFEKEFRSCYTAQFDGEVKCCFALAVSSVDIGFSFDESDDDSSCGVVAFAVSRTSDESHQKGVAVLVVLWLLVMKTTTV